MVPKGVILNIKLTAGSKKSFISTKVISFNNVYYLKASVFSIASENQADKELIKLVSSFFDIPKTRVSIIKGDKSSYKQVLFMGAGEDVLKNIGELND